MVPRLQPPDPSQPPLPDLERLFLAHAQQVARWAGWLGGPEFDEAVREEIVQEVFLTAQRLLPSFRGDSRVTTWLYRLTANAVRHRRRKDRWRRWLSGSAQETAGALVSSRPTPVEEMERRQSAELVYRVLDRLDERSRTALILFELEGLSGKEVAERMGASVDTMWVWLSRARARFLRELQALERSTARSSERGGGR